MDPVNLGKQQLLEASIEASSATKDEGDKLLDTAIAIQVQPHSNEVTPTVRELSDDDEDQPIQVGVVCAIQMSCHVIDSCCSTCQITPELIKIVEDNRWLCSDILHFVTQK